MDDFCFESKRNDAVLRAIVIRVLVFSVFWVLFADMPGKLRIAFHDLLISMHLDSHAQAR